MKNNTLFGHSLAYCNKLQRLVVGSEWENNQVGVLHVYDYDSDTGKFEYVTSLDPQNQDNITVRGLGSTVGISNDCTRVISGAPNSVIDGVDQVGSVVVFDLSNNQWKQTYLFRPDSIIPVLGFGRAMTVGCDGLYFAAAGTNKKAAFNETTLTDKVYIFEFNGVDWDHIEILPDASIPGPKSRFGTNLAFYDRNTLFIAVDVDENEREGTGTYRYKRSADKTWHIVDQIWPAYDPHERFFYKYGGHIALLNDNPNLFAVTATIIDHNIEKDVIYFLKRKSHADFDSNHPFQTLEMAYKQQAFGMQFCGKDLLGVSDTSTVIDGKGYVGTVRLYVLKDNKFQLDATLYPDEVFKSQMYGSALAFSHDCNTLFIGAHHKYGDNPRVYIYSREEDPVEPKSKTGLIVGIVIGVLILIGGVIGGVWYFKRPRYSPDLETKILEDSDVKLDA